MYIFCTPGEDRPFPFALDMASLETLVALARNGLCVCADLLPGGHFMKLPLKALLFELKSKVSEEHWVSRLDVGPVTGQLSVLNVCIAFLQVCAVCFNAIGALNLPAALSDYRRLSDAETLAAKSRSNAVTVGAELAARRATSNLAYSIARSLLAPSFAVLALYTMGTASQQAVEWALLLMQIALAISLHAMWRDIGYRKQKAANAKLVAVSPKTDDPALLASIEDFVYHGEGGMAAVVLRAEDAESVKEECNAWIDAARAVVPENQAKFLDLASRETSGALFDLIIFVLNTIAFFGYMVFPATYFGPFRRDPFLEWLGNFSGDLAWTIEPALVVAATFLARLPADKKPKAD